MTKLIVLTYVLFALVLFTQAQNFAQPDFSNVTALLNNVGYLPGSTDQPNGQTFPNKPHQVKTPQRFDDAKCPGTVKDCSIPIMDPNPKNVSVILGTIQPTRFLNARKVNHLHLAFASIVNHDLVRYGSGANASLPLLNWTIPTPDYGINGWVGAAGVPSELDGTVGPSVFKISRNNGPGGPGSGKPKGTVHTRPPWFDMDFLYETGGGRSAVGGPVNDGNNGWDNSTSSTRGEFFINNLGLPSFSAVQAFVWLCPSCPVVLPIFVREHNWYAQRLKATPAGAALNAEQVYKLAKRWTLALWQSIAFYEYAPILFSEPMPVYDPNNVPGNPLEIPQEVIMIAHYPYSEYNLGLHLLDQNFNEIGYVPTKGALSNAAFLTESFTRYGEAAFVRGAIATIQDNVDLYFTDAHRSVGNPGQFSSDTFARMLGRSREAGINTLNAVRRAYGLTPYADWNDFFSKTQLTQAQKTGLQRLYPNFEDLDFWTGGLAEWREETHMGETWTFIYKQYWINIRNADKFWFEGTAAGFTDAEKTAIRNTKMSDLILKHTAVKSLPCSAFFANAPDCPSAPPTGCASGGNPNFLEAVTGALYVNWTDTVAGSNAITFTVTAKATSGYLALGFPQVAGRMLGSEAFISTINTATNRTTTTVYKLAARQPCSPAGVGVCPNPNSPYKVSNANGQVNNGWASVTFTVTGPNITAGPFNLIASMGPILNNGNPNYHGANKGVGTVTLNTAPPATVAPTCAPIPSTSAPTPGTTAAPVKCSSAFSLGSSLVLLFIIALFML